MLRRLRTFVVVLAAGLVVAMSAAVLAQGTASRAANTKKIDKALQKMLRKGGTDKRRVIVRAKPGSRKWLEQRKSSLYDTYPSLRWEGPNGKQFIALSGTSMATGVVSGYRLTPNLAKAILQFTAIPLRDDSGNAYDVLAQGNVWGDNIVWGHNIVWSNWFDDNIVWGNGVLPASTSGGGIH